MKEVELIDKDTGETIKVIQMSNSEQLYRQDLQERFDGEFHRYDDDPFKKED